MNIVNEAELAETSSSDSKVSLGEVSANEHKPWTADIIVSQDCVTFKLDSRADVTVLPASTYNKLTYKPLLSKTQRKCYGPCKYDLRCRGEFQAMLKYGPKTWKTTIYALDDLNGPLLGGIACQKLGVVAKVDRIASPERAPSHMRRTHPKVFTGLSCMPGEYEIKLREGVTPFNHPCPIVFTTRQVEFQFVRFHEWKILCSIRNIVFSIGKLHLVSNNDPLQVCRFGRFVRIILFTT